MLLRLLLAISLIFLLKAEDGLFDHPIMTNSLLKVKELTPSTMRGAIAKKQINPGDIIIHVPAEFLITTRTILRLDTELAKKLAASLKVGGKFEVGEHALFALFIMRERERIMSGFNDKSSLLSRYVEDLILLESEMRQMEPVLVNAMRDEEDTQNFWRFFDSGSTLLTYEGSRERSKMTREAKKLCEWAREGYDKLIVRLGLGGVYDFDTYLWIWMIVETRFWEVSERRDCERSEPATP